MSSIVEPATVYEFIISVFPILVKVLFYVNAMWKMQILYKKKMLEFWHVESGSWNRKDCQGLSGESKPYRTKFIQPLWYSEV